ncbi:acetyl-CoA carboxylase [Lactobacillus sp. CBA3606]|nr:acetyl-CoA carboxylase [Lactobacillus sp. CBA3606]
MVVMPMTDDTRLINTRMQLLFKRLTATKYWLQIVNDPYDDEFNVFFNSQRKWERLKSVPLHSLHGRNLVHLELVVTELHHLTQLTIEYEGFAGIRWPKNHHLIQKVRHNYE